MVAMALQKRLQKKLESLSLQRQQAVVLHEWTGDSVGDLRSVEMASVRLMQDD